MNEEILKLALGNGLWAALFCVLFLYQLKDSRARERKYVRTIDALTDSVRGIGEVQSVCCEIQKDIEVIRTDLTGISISQIAKARRMRVAKEQAHEL